MVRDFSAKSKAELQSQIKQINDEQLCDVTDWFGDRWLDFQEWIGNLNIKNYLDDVSSYHKKVLDKNNTTLKNLEKIFNDVYAVDSKYKGKLNESIETCKAYNSLINELSNIILPSNGNFTYERINELLAVKFENYTQLLINVGQWEAYLKLLLENCELKGGMTEEDKLEYIRIYEKYNKEQAEQIEKLLSKLSEEEINRIKFYVYSVDEPYRSIYLQSMENYSLGNISGDDTGYFTPSGNTINVDMTEEPGNPRGPYTTFFHESGHAIDYNHNDDGSYYSMTYRNSKGQSLQDVIYQDVSNDVMNTIKNYTKNSESIKNIHNYIMGADTSDIDSLSKAERKILENVQLYYRRELAGAVNEAASDVYGGVTNNIIIGDYGHRSEGYWYRNGKATYAQSRELWAEYYSYCATGNENSLASLTEKFPNAKKFLDEMATSMVE